MRGSFLQYAALAAVILGAATVAGMDGGQEPATKSKALKLPYGWSRIGLSAEQKAEAQKIVSEANAKVAELQKQIDAVRAQEKKELSALLTDSQRTELRNILEAEGEEQVSKGLTEFELAKEYLHAAKLTLQRMGQLPPASRQSSKQYQRLDQEREQAMQKATILLDKSGNEELSKKLDAKKP